VLLPVTFPKSISVALRLALDHRWTWFDVDAFRHTGQGVIVTRACLSSGERATSKFQSFIADSVSTSGLRTVILAIITTSKLGIRLL
jgi:hypothetical protein